MSLRKSLFSPFSEIISQRQIDLEENWCLERVKLDMLAFDGFWMWPHFDSCKATLDGSWWHHYQLLIGPMILEWTIRGRQMT